MLLTILGHLRLQMDDFSFSANSIFLGCQMQFCEVVQTSFIKAIRNSSTNIRIILHGYSMSRVKSK